MKCPKCRSEMMDMGLYEHQHGLELVLCTDWDCPNCHHRLELGCVPSPDADDDEHVDFEETDFDDDDDDGFIDYQDLAKTPDDPDYWP